MQIKLETVAEELRALGWEVTDCHPRYGDNDPVPGYIWAVTHNDDNVDFSIRLDDDATGFISTVSGGGYSKSIPFTRQTLGTFELLSRHGYRIEVSEQQLERLSHEDAVASALQSIADDAVALAEHDAWMEAGDEAIVLLGRLQDLLTSIEAWRALGGQTTDERLDFEGRFFAKGTGR